MEIAEVLHIVKESFCFTCPNCGECFIADNESYADGNYKEADIFKHLKALGAIEITCKCKERFVAKIGTDSLTVSDYTSYGDVNQEMEKSELHKLIIPLLVEKYLDGRRIRESKTLKEGSVYSRKISVLGYDVILRVGSADEYNILHK